MLLILLLFTGQATAHAQTVPPTRITRTDPYTPNVPPRAIAYQRAGRVLGLAAIGWNLLGIWLFLAKGGSALLRKRLTRQEPDPARLPPFRLFALYFVLFMFLLMLWNLPFGFARFALEHAYGFSRQTVPELLGDKLLNMLFSLILLPVLWGGFWLHRRAPRRGWLLAWGALLPLLVFQFVLQPVLIAPAYNRFTPLESGPLRDKILALAGRAGIAHAQVLVEDTSRRTRHVNAYVTGIGPTARIVLNDTALHLLPEDQLLALMGHEMGHYVEGHIWVNLLAGMVGAGAFFWGVWRWLPAMAETFQKRQRISSLYDVAALPLLMLLLNLFILIQSPIANALSRHLERRADVYGLRLTGLNDATARLFVGFAERDYADPDPPPLLHLWFGSHPTLKDRITHARTFRP